MTPRLLAFVLLASLLAAPLAAQPAWYRIDPVHTRVLFFVEHARFSRSIGLFRPVEGGLWFDEADWTRSRVEVCLPLTSLDMGDRAWENALRRSAFFDAGRHPAICLRSQRIERLDQRRGRLHGLLEVRGIAREVAFEFTVNDVRRFSLTRKRRMGVSATATVSRAAFGMTRDPTLIGDAVEIVIELEAEPAPAPAGDDPEER